MGVEIAEQAERFSSRANVGHAVHAGTHSVPYFRRRLRFADAVLVA